MALCIPLFSFSNSSFENAIAEAKIGKKESQQYNKVYSKQFSTSDSPYLEFDFSFTDVIIEPSNRNEVAIEVEVEVEAANEKRGDDAIDRVSVNMDQKGDKVFANVSLNGQNGKHESFSIVARIKAPVNSELQLQHSFGDLTIKQLDGEMHVSSSYGDQYIAHVNHPSSEINISFSDLEIDNFGGAHLDVDYSDTHIGLISSACTVNNSFSDMRIDGIRINNEEVVFNNSYGDTRIHNIGADSFHVIGNSSFGNISLPRSFKIISESKDMFSEHVKAGASEGNSTIHIENSFGSVRITSSN